MSTTNQLSQVYTPEQVAEILQLSKNTVYELINKGEIVAKKIGRVYRVPASSISFVFTGLDADIYQAEQTDKKNLQKITDIIKSVRKTVWNKSRSS
ncbi:hypothetical protein A2966_04965 [Candidatus Roizmanbacteria bacterium RIFCSPLOWO2_01_FULL_41_22]|uniref:Helix-turn-helix domain-containing protein n=2 Tax=Candidatus Roizmaniibacteriota TaxID=1752723 RepID=A0A1F7JQU6_9BACT|nr:MAG: hypothetical protein A2966_04965 [Candidatus Roizmanbacteria bacterium RIFCSPLOWO2_01_FULL_41_22]OGK57968.1 MAG: hypothetical protein A3H86_03320 [Candidatus Roizmanbacteria bacterium RIFCSPLOWO2_02_FULL_41_9]